MEFEIATPTKTVNSEIFHRDNADAELYVRDGIFYISGVDSQEEADNLIAAHNPSLAQEAADKVKADAKAAALAKLQALGLTADEVAAITA
jgi:hypothetical protein